MKHGTKQPAPPGVIWSIHEDYGVINVIANDKIIARAVGTAFFVRADAIKSVGMSYKIHRALDNAVDPPQKGYWHDGLDGREYHEGS
jgi:hypothetical protein